MEPVTFATEDGVRLEGELRADADDPRGSAVICHPHPPTRPLPTLFVVGEHDAYCPADQLRDYAEHAAAEVLVIEGTDHHFWRREREMARQVGRWAEQALGQ